MARALVLGATGHIGAHIVRTLLAEGHQVRACFHRERFLHVLDGLSIERRRIDLESDNLDALRESLNGCEWVFHAAGYYPKFTTPRQEAIARGINSTRRIISVFKEAKPERIVFTSSAATIRRVEGRMLTESDADSWPPAGRQSVYATVKIAMEHEMLHAAEQGLPVVIVNPSLCFGEYDAHPFSGLAILVFVKYHLPFVLGHSVNTVYTGDVGIGHVRAAEYGRLGERYLLTSHFRPLPDIAECATRIAGVRGIRLCIPSGIVMAIASLSEVAAWVMRSEPLLPRAVIQSARCERPLDGSKAVRELRMPQTSMEESIRRAIGWFKAQGML